MRKIHLLVLLILIGSASYGQNLGLVLKVSTSGVGADLAYRINPKWLVKVGAESFNFEFLTNVTSADLNVDINSKIVTGSYSLLVDYQIYKKLYITFSIFLKNLLIFCIFSFVFLLVLPLNSSKSSLFSFLFSLFISLIYSSELIGKYSTPKI
jgi:hypothetical protein